MDDIIIYALNLDKETRRILSVTYPQYATPEMPIVEELPEGDTSDYIYNEDGSYTYSEAPWKAAERIAAELAELHANLNGTDYIFARGAEKLFALATETPTTLTGVIKWIRDVFAIMNEINTKYAEQIANRKVWRARIEELENE